MPSARGLSTAMERQFKGFGREQVLNYTRDAGDKGIQLTVDLFKILILGTLFYINITINAYLWFILFFHIEKQKFYI